jgi:purine-cytosine permease-like protein
LYLTDQDRSKPRRRFSRDRLPRSRVVRIVLGTALVVMGIFGWLPIVGFWMIPLGLLVLSVDFHPVRRLRRRLEVWSGRRRQHRNAQNNSAGKAEDK